MTSSKISAAAAARREAHRQHSGEFGMQAHSAPDTLLDEAPGAPGRHPSDQELLTLSSRDLEQVVMTRADRLAARYAGQYGWNTDQRLDFRQELLAQAVERINAKLDREGAGTRSASARELIENGGLMEVMARPVAQWVNWDDWGGRQFRHEDQAAWAELAQLEGAFEEQYGRPMTGKERDAAADRIRESRPAGRRPHIGFQNHRLSLTSIDMPVGGDGDGDLYLADVLADETDYAAAGRVGGDDSNPYLEAVTRREQDRYDQVAGDAPVSTDQAPRKKYGLDPSSSWAAFSHVAGINTGTQPIEQGRADDARATVDAYPGGASKLAADYRTGEVDEATAGALFAPFGSLSVAEEDALAAHLERHPQYADRLWGSAMTEAVRAGKRTATAR